MAEVKKGPCNYLLQLVALVAVLGLAALVGLAIFYGFQVLSSIDVLIMPLFSDARDPPPSSAASLPCVTRPYASDYDPDAAPIECISDTYDFRCGSGYSCRTRGSLLYCAAGPCGNDTFCIEADHVDYDEEGLTEAISIFIILFGIAALLGALVLGDAINRVQAFCRKRRGSATSNCMEAFTVVLFLGPPIVNLAVPDLVSPLTDFAAARCFTTDEGNTAFRNAESFRAGWTFLGFTGAGITLLLMVVTFLDGRVMKAREERARLEEEEEANRPRRGAPARKNKATGKDKAKDKAKGKSKGKDKAKGKAKAKAKGKAKDAKAKAKAKAKSKAKAKAKTKGADAGGDVAAATPTVESAPAGGDVPAGPPPAYPGLSGEGEVSGYGDADASLSASSSASGLAASVASGDVASADASQSVLASAAASQSVFASGVATQSQSVEASHVSGSAPAASASAMWSAAGGASADASGDVSWQAEVSSEASGDGSVSGSCSPSAGTSSCSASSLSSSGGSSASSACSGSSASSCSASSFSSGSISST